MAMTSTENRLGTELIATTGTSSSSPARLRTDEGAWRRTHPDQLRAYQGQWVVLEKNEIIASGSDVVTVTQQARDRGVNTPYIFYVEAMREEEGEISG
jgi:hypothetical protein